MYVLWGLFVCLFFWFYFLVLFIICFTCECIHIWYIDYTVFIKRKTYFYLISSYVKLFFCENYVHAIMKKEKHCYLVNFVNVKRMKMHNLRFIILLMTIPVKRRENLSNTSSCTYHTHVFMNEPLFSLINEFTTFLSYLTNTFYRLLSFVSRSTFSHWQLNVHFHFKQVGNCLFITNSILMI